jgi:DNA-binding transcriptional ArsR family regulator
LGQAVILFAQEGEKGVRKKPPPRIEYVKGLFLRGPIPLNWLTACSDLSGKTIMAALAIWWQAGMYGRQNVKLTTCGLKRFGVDRKAKDRALAALEEAGLITVTRQRGRNPLITLVTNQRQRDADQEQETVQGCKEVWQ